VATYNGPASIVTADGGEVDEVEASLVSREQDDPGDGAWFGTIRGEFDAFDLMEGEATIKLPDGRESGFVLTRTDLVVARTGVQISGTGPTPF
jgi:hypothetical protein